MKVVVGQKLGLWTVLADAGKNNYGNQLVRVRCNCGYEAVRQLHGLVTGKSKGCNSCYGARIRGVPWPLEDLTGKKFNAWTVLETLAPKDGHRRLLCRCDCGYEGIRLRHEIVSGRNAQCLDCRNKNAYQWNKPIHINLVGKKFNSWTVLDEVWRQMGRRRRRCLRVLCTCGNERILEVYSIVNGDRKQCKDCQVREVGKRNATHGLSRHPLFGTWHAMIDRCTNPRSSSYLRYGGRGILIYDGWLDSPKAFIEYLESELGPKPTPWHSLDRKDVDGNYEPGNLRWATAKEQRNNQQSHKAALVAAWVKANMPKAYAEALASNKEKAS